MTGRFLLDTSILSELVRHPAGPIARRLARIGDTSVCTSIIVAAELRYGAAKKASRRLSGQLDAILRRLEIVPLEPPCDVVYGELRARLERLGQLIGPNDMLIASQTLALGFILVTANEREFSRVAELRIENWLR